MREYFILITPDNAVSTVCPDETPTPEFFQKHLDCDCFTIIRFARKSHQIMLCDDSALLKPEPRFNAIASTIIHRPVYGNVLMAIEGERDGEPDIIGYNGIQMVCARIALHEIIMESSLFEDCEPEP